MIAHKQNILLHTQVKYEYDHIGGLSSLPNISFHVNVNIMLQNVIVMFIWVLRP